MIGKIKYFFFAVSFIVSQAVFTGCSSISKNMEYFQGVDSADLSLSKGLYDARIMPKDGLLIDVTTSDVEISKQFSLMANSSNAQGGNRHEISYLVENDGTINFPLIGRIKVQGLTIRECEDKIASLIKPYLANGENPVVTVEMSSYHITVMGEVGSPGVKEVTGQKMSILEALASAGDLTVYGRRDNILLIRESSTGEKSTVRLDINDPQILTSPYFYLQQNDVVYVTPNKIKAKNVDVSSHTTLLMTILGLTTSLSSLAIGLFRK